MMTGLCDALRLMSIMVLGSFCGQNESRGLQEVIKLVQEKDGERSEKLVQCVFISCSSHRGRLGTLNKLQHKRTQCLRSGAAVTVQCVREGFSGGVK